MLPLLLALLPSAPAPFLKKTLPPVTAASLAGSWDADWAGGDWVLAFRAGGRYHAREVRTGERWAGRWRLRRGVLEVRERVCGPGPSADGPLRWSVRLRPSGAMPLRHRGVLRMDGRRHPFVMRRRAEPLPPPQEDP